MFLAAKIKRSLAMWAMARLHILRDAQCTITIAAKYRLLGKFFCLPALNLMRFASVMALVARVKLLATFKFDCHNIYF